MATNESMLNVSTMFNSTQPPNYLLTGVYRTEYFEAIQVLAYVWPVIVLFGMVANIINIIVFLKAGTKDNVTILLLSLSMSDILFLALMTPTMSGFVMEALLRPNPWPFDPRIIFFFLYWPAFTAYDISTFISVSLGLMRCACVTMPLKFKSVFTKSRTLKWVLCLVVLAVSLRIPVLTMHRISRRRNPITNTSELYLLSTNMAKMSRINDFLNRGVMMYLAFITMVICVIILSFKLYESSKIRRSSTAKVTIESQSKPGKSNKQSMSPKDLQVIQSVTLVCVIFILCQLSFVVISLTRLINPEVDNRRRLHYLLALFNQCGVTSSYLNASLNIFVYYRYNSKYRATFQALFCGKENK